MNNNFLVSPSGLTLNESSLPSTESLLLQVSYLAFKFPELGLAQDLPALKRNELWGVLRYLKRHENKGAEHDKEAPL